MRKLPIYELASPLSRVIPTQFTPGCTRCALGTGRPGINSGIAPEGAVGGWLLVTDAPSVTDNTSGIPFSGGTGVKIRQALQHKFPDQVFAFATAVGCASSEVEDEHVAVCAPHLSHSFEVTQPKGVFVLGSAAALSVLGYRVTMDSVEGGYGFIPGRDGAVLPVVFLPAMHHLSRNRLKLEQALRIISRWVKGEVVLTESGVLSHLNAECILVEDALTAETVCTDIYMEAVERTVAVDVETWFPAFRGQKIVSIAISWKTPTGQIKSAVWDEPGLNDFDALAALQDLMGDSSILKVLHNGKFDEHAFYSDKRLPPMRKSYINDTRLMCKLLNPAAGGDLESCSVRVGMGGHKGEISDLLDNIKTEVGKYVTSLKPTPSGKKRQAPQMVYAAPHQIPQQLISAAEAGRYEPGSWIYRWLPSDARARYNARDTASTLKLHFELRNQMSSGQQQLLQEVIMPATHALAVIEEWGMPIDMGMLDILDMHIQSQLAPVQQRLSQYTLDSGETFNPGSRPQLISVLSKLGINPKGKTKTGQVSTDDKSLEPYAAKHQIIRDVLAWRSLTKSMSTYVQGVRDAVCPDGRIHATLLLDGTQTGRLSCQNPNLQNWPRAESDPSKPQEGTMLRNCVYAPPGWVLVEIDQSQVEIRVAAALSGDPEMLATIRAGKDFHSATAEMLYGASFTDQQRTASKITNFSLIYEIPENIGYMLSKSLTAALKRNVSKDEAQEIADMIFGRYKRLRAWMSECYANGKRDGGAYTIWRGQRARFRPLPELGLPYDKSTSKDNPDRSAIETAIRGTWNMPVQGTSSDLTTAALGPMVDWILSKNVPAQLFVPIHDSVVGMVREDALGDYVTALQGFMTQHQGWLGVPLNADVKTGHRLGSMKKWKR